MRTRIEIDDQLMAKAMRCSGAPSKKAVVEQALRMLIRARSQGSIRELFGKVEWEGNIRRSRRGRIPR
jgi:Arc/MetJ family transcription regulator